MLKKILILVLLSCFCAFALAGDGRFEKKALARGLFGKIRVKRTYESIPVCVVNGDEDLRVRVVTTSNPNHTGLWRFVDSGEDFLIHYEKDHSCLKVRFVQSGEGVSIR